MMARIGAAIRAVLAGMKRMVWKTAWIGDRLVSMLVPGDPVEPIIADEPPAQVAAAESMMALRSAANVLVQGAPLPANLAKAIPPMQAAWLQSMSRQELCKLILAKDEAIRLHMRGITPIKGLVPYHKDAIRDVTAARAERPKPTRVPRRTLRAVLAETEGGHPLVA